MIPTLGLVFISGLLTGIPSSIVTVLLRDNSRLQSTILGYSFKFKREMIRTTSIIAPLTQAK